MFKLDKNNPTVFDGAFGTYYSARGGVDRCELANTENPDEVLFIHREYIKAGAAAIKTNTFSLSYNTVSDESRLKTLIAAGVDLADKAAAGKAAVFADIGPISDATEEDYIKTAQIFVDLSVRCFLFETQSESGAIIKAAQYIKSRIPDSYIIVSFAVSPDGFTRSGKSVFELLINADKEKSIDAVGLNCICGPSHMASLVKKLIPKVSKPFCVMPNSGYPSLINGRIAYNDNADYFALKVDEMRALGAAALGGCCGTTPEYIRAIIKAIGKCTASASATEPEALPLIKSKSLRSNSFKAKLKSNEKIIAVEIDPPFTADYSKTLAAAELMKECGCDIITVTDSPLSRARADSLMTAAMITKEIGLPVMPHLSCRDRNTVALKAGLLAANALDVSCLLAVTGDPLTGADADRGVFSLNSFNLISYITKMNGDEFAASPYCVGGALNINAANFSAELKRASRKLGAGAEFFITQPISDISAVKQLELARRTLKVPVIAGLMPVTGYKNALFLKNEVSGIVIPDELLDNLINASREEAAEISVDYTAKIAAAISPYCDGYCLMTPMSRADIIAKLINKIKD